MAGTCFKHGRYWPVYFVVCSYDANEVGGAGGPGGILISKPANFQDKDLRKHNFADVAGLDEAKVEVMEIVISEIRKNIPHLEVNTKGSFGPAGHW
jgi:hypothetical protein